MTDQSAVPEVADRHRRNLVWALAAVAVLNASSAAQRAVEPEMAQTLQSLEVVLVLLLVLALLPMLVWKFRNRDQSLRYLYFDESGYVAHSLHRAKNVSWATTFVFLSLLAPFAEKLGTLPGEFFVYLSLAVMTSVFAITFFVLNWTGGDGGNDNEERV